MATTRTEQSVPTSQILGKDIPPLRNGDHLDAEKFLRRYEAMPHLKKAELLDGRVFIHSPDSYPSVRGDLMASPVSCEEHSAPHFDLIGWMAIYRFATPGIRGGDNGTVRLEPKSMPQPDALLLILPSHGGQTTIGIDKFVQGAPELVAEVAYSSVSYDLHEKLEIYRKHGVREYIAWRVEDHSIEWFVSRGDRFEPICPDEDGLLRSEVFPGLWLDATALLSADMDVVVQAVQRGIASDEHTAFVAKLLRAGQPG
jgi:Uma2 family endonuclease